ncbi:hypothetical protein ACP275_12G051900 [Erythranthe tilingii]
MSTPGRGYLSSYRGRGGRGKPPNLNYDGRNDTSNTILHHGKKKLIAQSFSGSNTSSYTKDPLHDEFQEFLKQKQQKEGNIPESSSHASYANIVKDDDDSHLYIENLNKEIILLIEEKDSQWADNPWIIMERYLSNNSLPYGSYKPRGFYENILVHMKSVEINHFSSGNEKEKGNYSFSKIIIKKIISFEEWGISPLNEKEMFSQNNTNFKFNYFDYIESFYKTFYFENKKQRHSWFIKICENIFHKPIPTWFFSWWRIFGPSTNILPEKFSSLMKEWVAISPSIQNKEKYIEGKTSCIFFIEFGIPWIWKWKPTFGYTNYGAPCLWRIGMCKFWEKLMRLDTETGEIFGSETIEKIKEKINIYRNDQEKREEDENTSPFKLFAQKYSEIYPKEKIIDIFLEQMKKDISKQIRSSESDASMNSDLSFTKSNNPMRDAQDPEDDIDDDIEDLPDIDNAFEKFKDSLLK